jgi:hypothetical protein
MRVLHRKGDESLYWTVRIQRMNTNLVSNIELSIIYCVSRYDRLCGLVVRVFGYRYGGPGLIPGTTRKKMVVGLERGPFSLESTTEELLDRKVAAPV